MNKELENRILEGLGKRGYKDVTVKTYFKRLHDLFDYYSGIEPIKISKEQVTKYAIALRRRQSSISTIRQLIYACDFFFEELNGIKHGHYGVKLPVQREKSIEFFTQEEAVRLIESKKKNIKHKTIVTLMYACGISVTEIMNLKLSHVRSKNSPPIIQIFDDKNQLERKIKIPSKVMPLLTQYFREHKPTSWFFYAGTGPEKPYGRSSINNIVNNGVKELGLNQELNPKSLTLSYMKHLTELGVPLINILLNKGITGYSTFGEYAKLIYGTKEVEFSPYERKLNENAQIQEFKDLENLLFKVKTEIESNYLLEGIQCFRIGALRAGVIFIWSAAIWKIHNLIIEKSPFKVINEELLRLDKSSRKIKSIDSFQHIKDETSLQLAEKVGIFDKQEKNELINICLGLRNKCGHPTNFKPEIHRVNSFVENIINLVYEKHDI